MLECGLQQVEMDHAITELQYEAALLGYRQSRVSSDLKYLLSRPSYTKDFKERYDNGSVGACRLRTGNTPPGGVGPGR